MGFIGKIYILHPIHIHIYVYICYLKLLLNLDWFLFVNGNWNCFFSVARSV